MALVYLTGWEMGSNPADSVASSIITSPTRGSYSSYALGSTNSDNMFLLPSTYSEIYWGFGFYMGGTNDPAYMQVVSPNNQIQVALGMVGNQLVYYAPNLATEIGNRTAGLTNSVWYYVEGHVVISATVGVVEIKVNGTSNTASTNQNTKGDGASGVTDRIKLKPRDATMDDFYVCDTSGSQNTSYLGDIRVSGYIPNAAGDVTGLSRGGSDSGSNYGQIDERPPNDATDYVYGTNTSSYDLYNLPNTSGVSSVKGVNLWARAQKSDAGTANLALGVKYDSDANGTADTESWGSDLALSTSWAYYKRLMDIDPASAAWTPAKVDALQIGVKSR